MKTKEERCRRRLVEIEMSLPPPRSIPLFQGSFDYLSLYFYVLTFKETGIKTPSQVPNFLGGISLFEIIPALLLIGIL